MFLLGLKNASPEDDAAGGGEFARAGAVVSGGVTGVVTGEGLVFSTGTAGADVSVVTAGAAVSTGTVVSAGAAGKVVSVVIAGTAISVVIGLAVSGGVTETVTSTGNAVTLAAPVAAAVESGVCACSAETVININMLRTDFIRFIKPYLNQKYLGVIIFLPVNEKR